MIEAYVSIICFVLTHSFTPLVSILHSPAIAARLLWGIWIRPAILCVGASLRLWWWSRIESWCQVTCLLQWWFRGWVWTWRYSFLRGRLVGQRHRVVIIFIVRIYLNAFNIWFSLELAPLVNPQITDIRDRTAMWLKQTLLRRRTWWLFLSCIVLLTFWCRFHNCRW